MDNFTDSQKKALKWLSDHNGDGVFDKHGVLLAGGESAPFMRSTWNHLRSSGLVTFYRINGAVAWRVKVSNS